jgi:hypothetical protein
VPYSFFSCKKTRKEAVGHEKNNSATKEHKQTMQIDSNSRGLCEAKKPEITYPCVWQYKVIGEDITSLTRAITTVCPTQLSLAPSKTSSGGKYCSLNVEIEVADEASRLAIYQNLKNHLAVKMVL